MLRLLTIVLAVTVTGCGTSSGNDAGTTAKGCGAKVKIAFFSDATCTTQVGSRSYDTSLSCFSWSAAGSSAQDNSATRFQCYRDRLCYTQHPDVLTCEGSTIGKTDKQAKNNECLKEPDGSLYSKILSGNEDCPDAPAGFECPTSASRMGTDGIVACTNANP